jgi:hypothetical protein
MKNERRAAKARERNPNLPPYVPGFNPSHAGQVRRGPSGNPPVPHLAEGLELAGQSLKHDKDGNVTGGWDLGRRAGDPNPVPPPPDFAMTGLSRMMRNGDEVLHWETYDKQAAAKYQAFIDAIDRHAAQYEGLIAAAPAPAHTSAELLAMYPIGDYHLGMLAHASEAGANWDLRYGKHALVIVMRELVRQAPDAERAIIVNLGDFLHAQDDAKETPGHGNKLDVDGRHWKVADAALLLLVTVIDLALEKHRHVTVRNIPGNHDPRVAAGLARELRAWYRNEPRIEIADANREHQYDRFGNCLFGYHHGDRTPAKELPAVMAVDERKAWGECEFCYWHTGHVHHDAVKAHPGARTESHRIIPPGDAWNAGRYRSSRGMSVITYHRNHGEIGRAIVGIERFAAELERAVKGAT